jgi:hypothetical protein
VEASDVALALVVVPDVVDVTNNGGTSCERVALRDSGDKSNSREEGDGELHCEKSGCGRVGSAW